ncbi:hypothetical protein ROA7450_03084 [Roseovarius albus]|uniref:Glycosyltransferase 61 catalytic domain-containing protein n=1 Tax=Roseovarius albus TaxID=1247867 RepID=A0A1X6ZS01_9RHOB|nr:glycosyltransferase family 61 protein [Roseovarius albus]SLN59558.1 hypothetical protein ROA7450_03084 [Roseovarius albus]
MIRKTFKALKKIQKNAIGQFADGWMLDQQVPLQSVFRSRFDYEIHDFGKHEIYAPELKPDNPANYLKQLKLHYNPQVIPRPYYFHLNNAGVFNRQIVDPENSKRVILESFPEGSMQDEGRNFQPELSIRRKALKHAIRRNTDVDEGYVFSGLWWKNYYHFLVDSCLRFVDLQEQGAFRNNTTLLFHSQPNKWQQSYLDLLGLGDHESVLTDQQPLKVGKLLVASPRRHRFVVSIDAATQFRHRMFDRLGMADAEPTRKIFVSRRGAKVRRILNEEEVESCLIEHGFEILKSEKLSVEDQIKLFAQAKTIVAPHGAGLANMIYSQKPSIIELFPADRWNIGYFLALTNSIGGTHIPIICAPENDADDFNVDIEMLRSALKIT